MRCSSCDAIAKKECSECHNWVCKLHSNDVFDEKTRAVTPLCGTCYAKQRAVFWQPRKSFSRRR